MQQVRHNDLLASSAQDRTDQRLFFHEGNRGTDAAKSTRTATGRNPRGCQLTLTTPTPDRPTQSLFLDQPTAKEGSHLLTSHPLSPALTQGC